MAFSNGAERVLQHVAGGAAVAYAKHAVLIRLHFKPCRRSCQTAILPQWKVSKIKTDRLKQVVNLTDQINRLTAHRLMTEGLCSLFRDRVRDGVPDDRGSRGGKPEKDLLDVVQQMIPKIDFQHGPPIPHTWSHMASSILGPSLTIPVFDCKLVLGTWQSILLVGLRRSARRDLHVTLIHSECFLLLQYVIDRDQRHRASQFLFCNHDIPLTAHLEPSHRRDNR